MSNAPDNFDGLRKLLALKQHEQPPPGYFDQLSQEIFSRLDSGEARRAPGVDESAGWLGGLWALLDAKPILAGAFGVAVCGLMLGGILYSQRMEPAPDKEVVAQGMTNSGPQLWGPYQYVSFQTNSSTSPLLDPQLPNRLFGDLPSDSPRAFPASLHPIGN